MVCSVLNGNELLIQGALEAGFHLYTGYPGSPLADYFNILHDRSEEFKQRGLKVVVANSEANAAAMASGAKMAGKNTLVAMKSMGLNVASDALIVGNFATPGKNKSCGTVVVVGDDPWSMSTSAPADSRYLFKHLHMPFLEPSTTQEVKDWVKYALELSIQSSLYVGHLLTTAMAEGGGRVELGEEAKLDIDLKDLDPKTFDLSQHVMVPPNSLKADQRMIEERFPKVVEILQKMNLDKRFGKLDSEVTIISSGQAAEITLQVLQDTGLINEWQMVKVATSYPLVPKHLLEFLKGTKTLIVVEEKRNFLQAELAEFLLNHGMKIEVHGKDFFPAFGGLSYEIIFEKLQKFKNPNFLIFKKNEEFKVPPRLPTFCPGCPHRETLSLMKELRKELQKEGVELISHGDVGCYSLSFLPPFKEMHDLSAMGQGGALGAGTDIFIKNPSVVLMGDSTFFHSGMSAISSSIQLGHNITYILLDNDNTAMTGHQVSPASGVSVMGETRVRQEMVQIVRGMGLSEENCLEVNPSDRYFYRNLLLGFIKRQGTKVIVSNKECALTYQARLKKWEREQKVVESKIFYQINSNVCEDCRVCVDLTGCPGLTQIEDAYGTKVSIDAQICVSDSYCTKMKACPSFEKVEVKNYQVKIDKQLLKIEENFDRPNNSTVDFPAIAQGKKVRIVVIGVGGSGVTTISRVLSQVVRNLPEESAIDFKFFDQKGLAQRNGSVISHLMYFQKGKAEGNITPLGSADLILSPDLLEAIRAYPFLGANGVVVMDQDFQIPTSSLLERFEGEKNFKSEDYLKQWQEKIGERAHVRSFKNLSYEMFGRAVFSSTMILGYAFQLGLLPGSLEDYKKAIQSSMRKSEWDLNWNAFLLGRSLVKMPMANDREKKEIDKEIYIRSIEESYFFPSSKKEVVEKRRDILLEMEVLYPEIPTNYWEQWTHDVAIFEGAKNLESFFHLCIKLKNLYSAKHSLKVVRVLAKTYFIKDEVFVSHQMISPLKKKKDQEIYDKLGTNFHLHPINRPSFDLGFTKLEFDLSPKIWMLKIMRHMRFLRKILSAWHRQDKLIQTTIRHYLLETFPLIKDEALLNLCLDKLDNIKGFREVRYQAAEIKFKEIDLKLKDLTQASNPQAIHGSF